MRNPAIAAALLISVLNHRNAAAAPSVFAQESSLACRYPPNPHRLVPRTLLITAQITGV
ncbi:MAG: hypothetical protein ACFBSG_16405 [Leptolyngbyaceae cyanobacterium]